MQDSRSSSTSGLGVCRLGVYTQKMVQYLGLMGAGHLQGLEGSLLQVSGSQIKEFTGSRLEIVLMELFVLKVSD